MTSQRGDTVAGVNLGGSGRQGTCDEGPYDGDLDGCGTGQDNPKYPKAMSLDQEKHSFTVLHRQKSTFYAEMNTLDGGGGRNYIFGFASSLAPICDLNNVCNGQYINWDPVHDARRLDEEEMPDYPRPIEALELGQQQTPWFPGLKPPERRMNAL